MELIWGKKLDEAINFTKVKSVKLSDQGEIFILYSKLSSQKTANFYIRKINAEESFSSTKLLQASEQLATEASMDFINDQTLMVWAYSSSSFTSNEARQGILNTAVNAESLSSNTRFNELTDDIITFQAKTKKSVQSYQDNFLYSNLHLPYVLTDGSFYLVAEIENLDNRKGQKGNVYISKFTKDGTFEWVESIRKDQQDNGTFPYVGSIVVIKDDKIHLLHNDYIQNNEKSDEETIETATSTKKELVIFEYVIDPDGSKSLNLPDLSKLSPKRVNLNTESCYVENNPNAPGYLSINVQSGAIFKVLYMAIH